MSTLESKAYAKINLFLDIQSKRNDGYHNIISVMQSVSLCDIITVKYEANADREIVITCNDPDIPLGQKNIAYKAADMFLNRISKNGRVKIHINKNIPAAAGLAGGSTDAATVLVLLNRLTECSICKDELISIGARIGADVPFCIVGGTKLALGAGGRMSDFPSMPTYHLVISCMGDGVSTPWAYEALDHMYENFENYTPRRECAEMLKAGGKKYFDGMFNIFESAVLPVRPLAAKVKDTLLKCGAEFAMMSGSGPSVFGIFHSKEEAENAALVLRSIGAVAHVCTPVDQ